MPWLQWGTGAMTGRRMLAFLLVVTAGLACWQVALPAPRAAATTIRDYFPVPDAALVRPLGEIDPGTCAPAPAAQECQGAAPSAADSIFGNYPMSVPGLGIPVGGVGAGSFMINQAGTFGPWNFGGQQGSSWETRILPQAAFHVREQIGNDPATVRTLATDGPQRVGTQGPVAQRSWGSPLPAWNALQPGEGSYAALYPFGWMSYTPFKTDVSMRFFSPIVAKEDQRTSLPVVYFDVRIANHTSDPAKMSVMFTMPNAPDHVAGTLADPTVATPPATVRQGFSSHYQSTDGVQAVTMSADDPGNTPDAANSEWTLAAMPQAGQKVSYTTSWNANGDGSDVYAPFTADGSLPDKPIDASSSAGAVSVSVNLSPGQVATVPFALAWDFPQVGFDNNQTTWMRRYTDFYGAQENAQNEYVQGTYPFHQSFAIAHDALLGHGAALSAVQGWWNPVATDPTYPAVLRTSALNELSMLVFQNSFWEGGLVSNSVVPTGFPYAGPGQHLGASTPGTHLFGFQDTGAGGVSGMGRTTDIQAYGYRAYYSLFPNLFRGILTASAEATELASNHNAPDLYVNIPNGDPFITWGNPQTSTTQGGTDSRPPVPGVTEWGDSPSKYIFQWYAYAKLTGDQSLLQSS
ncbi:GH116 family glycosyl-hydrolase, partial [Sinomonas humi]